VTCSNVHVACEVRLDFDFCRLLHCSARCTRCTCPPPLATFASRRTASHGFGGGAVWGGGGGWSYVMSAVGILARDTPSPPQHATPAETRHAIALKHESPVLKTTSCFSAQDYIRRRPSVFPRTHTHTNAHARTHTQRGYLHILTIGRRNEDYCRCLAHKIGMRALDYARGRSAAPGNHVDAGGDVPLRATLRAAAGFYFALCHIITRSCVSDNLFAQTRRERERERTRERETESVRQRQSERARERESERERA